MFSIAGRFPKDNAFPETRSHGAQSQHTKPHRRSARREFDFRHSRFGEQIIGNHKFVLTLPDLHF